MVTLLASLLLGSSVVPSVTGGVGPQTFSKVIQQASEQQAVPFLPGANQHVRHWPGISGDGRVAPRGTSTTPPETMRPFTSGSPVSTVTLLQAWTVQNYTDAQWLLLFQTLANQGITSVVFASSVDETEGAGQVLGTSNAYPASSATAWYPASSIVTNAYPNVAYAGNALGATRSPISECLYYAQHNGVNNGMSVYLGLNFYPDEWGFRRGNVHGSGYTDPITDSKFCASEARLGTLVASDLSSQFGSYSSFAGWYWPWEVDNIYFDKNIGSSDNSFLPAGYATSAYNNLISMLETSYLPLSGKPRLLSPFFNPYYMNTEEELPYSAYTATEYGMLWQEIFATEYEGSPLFTSTDIFAPQDGAGDYQPLLSGSGTLQGPPSIATVESVINTWYPPLLQAAAIVPGMQVWANADTYQVDVQAEGAAPDYVENDPAYSAEPWVDGAFLSGGMRRIAAQFQTEATVTYAGAYHVSRIMNCSNAYYFDPLAIWSNSALGSAWSAWQTAQSLGNSNGPSAPIVTLPVDSSGHCRLTLAVASSPNGVCGFDIWRDSYTLGTTPYVCCEIPVSPTSTAAFTDPDPTSCAGTHTYYLAAYDVYGNVSAVTQFTHSGNYRVTFPVSTLAGGASTTGTISMSAPAPAGGTTFSLSSNSANATAPATVTVAAGSTTATFRVSTTGLTDTTTVDITASAGGESQSATLTITADTVSSVSVSPTTIYGGSTAMGTVTLNAAAGPGGVVVSLYSSSNCATVLSTVTVAAGAATASFPISTTGVTGYTTVGITAAIASSSQTDYVGVVPAGVVSVTLSPSSVVEGSSSTATVTLNGVAGPGGEVVTISSNSGTAGVPATIIVPAGAKTATFTVKTTAVSSTAIATITAGADYVYASANLTITTH